MNLYFCRLLAAGLFIFSGAIVSGGEEVDRGTIKPGTLKIGASLLDYPTLVNPNCSHCRDEAKRRAGELRDNDRVLAWIRGKYDGGAVPLRFFLVPYRVISDSYGVFVYDHEAGFMRGFEPSYDFVFDGWRNGVLSIKHKDGTRFSALSGIAFDGPRKGESLKPIATLATDWGYWLATNPGTVAYHMFDKYKAVEAPAKEDAAAVASRLAPDKRLEPNEEVIGIALGKEARAYPIAALEKAGGVVADSLGGENVLVLWYAQTHTAVVYSNAVEGAAPQQKITLKVDAANKNAPFVDPETSSRWGIEGRAVEGPLKGKTLRWLPGVQCKWFAWSAEYPETSIYKGGAKKPHAAAAKPIEGIIVEPAQVSVENVALWKGEGKTAVAVVLDEKFGKEQILAAEKNAAGALELYFWIEVGRNPALAEAHPEWLASLGIHGDWHKNFPASPVPDKGQVAKAWPWVPIAYRGAFDAHLKRVATLLERTSGNYRGLLLNDLQGGPASCGCGNLQCRWAIDYSVPATAPKLEGSSIAADFLAKVRVLAAGKSIIPIWTTECEDQDLAIKNGRFSSGYCGSVPCSMKTCPIEFSKQWAALRKGDAGALGVLALTGEFKREKNDPAKEGGWIPRVVEYLNASSQGAEVSAVPNKINDKLWLVLQGYDSSPEQIAADRADAGKLGVAAIFTARTRIDQSYLPKIVPAK